MNWPVLLGVIYAGVGCISVQAVQDVRHLARRQLDHRRNTEKRDMMDLDLMEAQVEENSFDLALQAAYLGIDFRKLYDEGVQLRADDKPEPGENSGWDQVRSLGRRHEAERGWGGES